MGLLDLPIPINGAVYNLPVEWLVPTIIMAILSLWFWRKSRLAKRITTWVLKAQKSGAAEIYPPSRELDTAVEYTDKDGNSQRPFKPNYTYVPKAQVGDMVKTEDGIGKIIEMIQDPDNPEGEKLFAVDIEGKSIHSYSPGKVTLVVKDKLAVKRGSVYALAPQGWNERLLIHPDGTDELFDFMTMWEGQDETKAEEGGAARLLKEGADIFSSLKERLKANFREMWWLWIIVGIMFFLGGILVGGKYVHIQ
jgi:hypothetical protein